MNRTVSLVLLAMFVMSASCGSHDKKSVSTPPTPAPLPSNPLSELGKDKKKDPPAKEEPKSFTILDAVGQIYQVAIEGEEAVITGNPAILPTQIKVLAQSANMNFLDGATLPEKCLHWKKDKLGLYISNPNLFKSLYSNVLPLEAGIFALEFFFPEEVARQAREKTGKVMIRIQIPEIKKVEFNEGNVSEVTALYQQVAMVDLEQSYLNFILMKHATMSIANVCDTVNGVISLRLRDGTSMRLTYRAD